MVQAQFGNLGGQPILILPEGTLRSKGRDAQRNNIEAAKAVADAVRTTLGPKGMDKMLVDSLGDITITNDGATILENMQIEHPAAKMMVEIAKTQDQEVGDGTTTAVVIAGELLKKAGELLDEEIHPTVITKGFKLAKQRAFEVLEGMAKPVSVKDDAMLTNIASTAMTGKSAERAGEALSKVVVSAVKKVAEETVHGVSVDFDNVKLEKKKGGAIQDTNLIDGIVIDKEVVHPAMPKMVEKAKIALLDVALEIKTLENDAKINIDSPEKIQAFLNNEEKMLKDMSEKVISSGATVVLCQKGIDDMVQHFLAKKGIMAARRVKKSDMEKLAKATGAKVVTSLSDFSASDLGFAGVAQEHKIAGDQMIFIEKCKDPKAVTILIRGGTEHVIDEIERAMEDAIKGLGSALELGKIVPGGGAPEIEVAKELRKFADKFKGKEQLAILAFASAMEIIPRSLAENAGLDAIDKLAQLRAEHEKSPNIGLDVFTEQPTDMLKAGVVEPLKIKLQALKSATEVADLILRIDDMISSGAPKGGGMPPGMPGMGGME